MNNTAEKDYLFNYFPSMMSTINLLKKIKRFNSNKKNITSKPSYLVRAFCVNNFWNFELKALRLKFFLI